jgi:urease accessory protein UreF
VALAPEELEDALGGAAFGADLAAMEHETQEVRLFRT